MRGIMLLLLFQFIILRLDRRPQWGIICYLICRLRWGLLRVEWDRNLSLLSEFNELFNPLTSHTTDLTFLLPLFSPSTPSRHLPPSIIYTRPLSMLSYRCMYLSSACSSSPTTSPFLSSLAALCPHSFRQLQSSSTFLHVLQLIAFQWHPWPILNSVSLFPSRPILCETDPLSAYKQTEVTQQPWQHSQAHLQP